MRRVGVLCAVAVAVAVLAPGGQRAVAQGQASAAGDTETAAPWALISVSRDERTLFVRYQSGGCEYGGHAAVTETGLSVTVHVSQFTRSGATSCPAIVSFPLLAVPLAAPIAGRRVLGNECPMSPINGCPPPGPVEVFRGNDVLRRVPRLIGLASVDARAALRRQGFPTRVRRRGSVVVGERPAPGATMGQTDRRPVVLVRGRGVAASPRRAPRRRSRSG